MSRKNSREEKKMRKLRKLYRDKSTLPTRSVDLIDYVRTRTRCSRGMAEKVLLSGALEVDGNIVGVREVEDPVKGKQRVLDQFIPADMSSKIVVVKPLFLDQHA